MSSALGRHCNTKVQKRIIRGGDMKKVKPSVVQKDTVRSTAYLSREEVIEFLNEMLEAERAGSRVALRTSKEGISSGLRSVIVAVHRDENRWCAMLIDAIRRLGGTAGSKTGSFYQKAMAIHDASERLRFLNRGQGWVVRKLTEIIPGIEDEALHISLRAMLSSHLENIEKVASLEPEH
jgi:nitronate monooxygenase